MPLVLGALLGSACANLAGVVRPGRAVKGHGALTAEPGGGIVGVGGGRYGPRVRCIGGLEVVVFLLRGSVAG